MKIKAKTFYSLVGAAVTGAALTFVFADVMYKYGTQRNFPKTFKPKSRKPSEKAQKILDMQSEGKKYLDSLFDETLTIQSEDGLKLVGHFFKPQNPKRCVIMAHGWRGSWSGTFGAYAKFLIENGCSILLIEERCQGNSEGEHIGLGLLEKEDITQWCNYIAEEKTPGIPLYLFGVSMGAAAVIMASGNKLPENTKGIIADCGFTSPKEIARYIIRKDFHLWPHPLITIIDRKCLTDLGVSIDSYSTFDALKENKIPMLFIHGKDDKFVPTFMSVQNYDACKAPKELFLVEGAAHGQSYFMAKDEYEKIVLSFFKKHD